MRFFVDPLDAFFSGIQSGIVRPLLAFGAILAGFAICLWTSDWQTTASFWMLATVGLLFWWGAMGGWFYVGLLSLLTMMGLFWAFFYEWRSKLSFFAIFTASLIYYSPLTFFEERWVRVVMVYLVVTFCYWVLPYLVARLFYRKS